MKTLRMFGMALVAIIMGVSLSSCNKDENPENGGDFSNEKKLVKMVCESGDWQRVYTFNYDDSGRVIKATKDGHTCQIIWGDDAVKIDNGTTITLENGLIQRWDDYMTFTYNTSNRFVKWETNGTTKTAIWDGDKLVSISNYYGGDNILTYKGTCKKGYFPFYNGSLVDDVTGGWLFSAHPELIGARSRQLPATETYDNRTINFTYEFDEEGYISKINEVEEDTYTYTLTWE